MLWDVEGTDEFADWYSGLPRRERAVVEAAIQELEAKGPGLGRPRVDSLKGTRLKELRTRGGAIRMLFRFDARRTAILLVGGSKRDEWSEWYVRMIPVGERLWEEYQAELRKEGLMK